MGHIGPYASELMRRGHSCSIVVESFHPQQTENEQSALYEIYSHKELAANRSLFSNGKPADLIHAWTPRENVRQLTLDYRRRHPLSRLVIHLEDNEESILESYYQTSIEKLRLKSQTDPDQKWHPQLSHPVEYRRFLAIADAITLITPTLRKLLPIPKDAPVINPIVETKKIEKTIDPIEVRKSLELPTTGKLIVFPGGITSNNRDDLRDLYIAVHSLQQKGIDIRIVKTGPSCSLFERSFQFPVEQVAIDLGYIDASGKDQLLQISDILVQPGRDNEFNRDRFPCKIPEFFSSGRPCIIPEFYIPENIPEDIVCIGLKTSTPEEIATKIERLLNDPILCEKIAQNAKNYASEVFKATTNANRLEKLYKDTIAKKEQPPSPEPILFEDLELNIRELQQEIEANQQTAKKLQDVIQDKDREIEDAANEIAAVEQELEQWKIRDVRRRSTVSWKVTTPLRALRRALIDPLYKPTPELSPTPPVEPETSPEPVQEELEIVEPSSSPSAESPNTPSPGHRCYIKNYHKFVEREEWVRSIYLDKYKHPKAGPTSPKISILLPVYNVAEEWLRKCINSVIGQAYQNWELCIADDASTDLHIAPLLIEYEQSDPRIRITTRPTNGHISAASNAAFELATGDYIALLDHDDELPPHALAKVVETISHNPHAKLIYSDEDKIDAASIRHDPHFKSDWNYDLLLSCNMISHLGVYRRDVYETVGGFRVGYEGAQDWDLALRVTEQCEDSEIVHIPEVLYHWRAIETSTAHHHSAKNYAHEAQGKAIADHLKRIGKKGQLISIDGIHWRVRYPIPDSAPSVSIIVPTKNRYDLLSKCIQSILEKTVYPNYEILIVDNNSSETETLDYLEKLESDRRIRVLRYTSEFNYSAINNFAVSQSSSEIICLLNNDTEVISPDWLNELVSHASRPEVGVVGAKLLYPDDHIQHAGIILGIDGVAKHAFRFLYKDDFGHVHRANLISQWSAVTGACMATRRQLWETLGGLDENNLSTAYNDVDYCIRAREEGHTVLLTPYALLRHKESATRGFDQTSEQLALHHTEAAYMYNRWPKEIWKDPYYNPNFAKTRNDFEYVT